MWRLQPQAFHKPSKFPVAQTPFVADTVVSLELERYHHSLWDKYSETICTTLLGRNFALTGVETKYLDSNSDAIIHEAKEELKALTKQGCRLEAKKIGGWILQWIYSSEDRPFFERIPLEEGKTLKKEKGICVTIKEPECDAGSKFSTTLKKCVTIEGPKCPEHQKYSEVTESCVLALGDCMEFEFCPAVVGLPVSPLSGVY
ncbi:hypothetical protein MW887_010724 [Aspergillus wentii]|nr:hypothetical protein MW887_010724 [Aspergillus wentii]